MELNVTGVNRGYANGTLNSASVSFQSYESGNSLNANVAIATDDLDDKAWSAMSDDDLITISKKIVAGWLNPDGSSAEKAAQEDATPAVTK